MAGSALVLIRRIRYAADIDPVRKRIKVRPAVAGSVTLNTASALGLAATVVGLILLLFITVQATLLACLDDSFGTLIIRFYENAGVSVLLSMGGFHIN